MTHVTTFDQLNTLVSPLHDCPFDLDRATFDPLTHEWHGTFLRPLWDSPLAVHQRRAFIVTETRLPIAEATLSFRRVTRVRTRNDQGIGTYTLNEARCLPTGVTLAFNEALEIDILLDGTLDATYEEHPLPGRTAVYRNVGFGQTGPEIEAGGSEP